MDLGWTFSENKAEHTAAIIKDWPAALTRNPTVGCSEQLRILKAIKRRKYTELEKKTNLQLQDDNCHINKNVHFPLNKKKLRAFEMPLLKTLSRDLC